MATEGHPSYEVDLRETSDGVLVAMGGVLDPVAAPYMRERLVEAVKDGPGSVRIDLTDVTFLDSRAIGLLLSTKKRVGGYGGAFSMKCGHPPVRLVLEIMGLIEYLNVDSTG
jgi:anti-sigma B factor antagonist